MERTIIEVNGVKLEVDLRTAKRIDQLKVGDRVKVLLKTYSDYKVHAGTVVGFEPFTKLPTIIVAYLDIDYNGATVKFVYFNAETKDTEIVAAIDNDQLDVNKADVLGRFDREIEKKQAEADDLRQRRAFFETQFRAYWTYSEPVSAE